MLKELASIFAAYIGNQPLEEFVFNGTEFGDTRGDMVYIGVVTQARTEVKIDVYYQVQPGDITTGRYFKASLPFTFIGYAVRNYTFAYPKLPTLVTVNYTSWAPEDSGYYLEYGCIFTDGVTRFFLTQDETNDGNLIQQQLFGKSVQEISELSGWLYESDKDD